MSVWLAGNLTRDPELRFTAGGLAVLSCSVAVNRKRGEEETVSYFNVTAFGSLAEHAADSLTKGMRVVVCGRLEQRSWEQPDGTKRSAVDIIADELSPSLRWAKTDSSSTTSSANSRPTRPALDEEPF